MRDSCGAGPRIDLVVTSMGDAWDEDDVLCMFLKQSGQDLASLRAAGWIGDVQYRPYSAKGPMKPKLSDLRVVTPYGLEDLVRVAGRKNKHVIQMARQCGICGRSRAQALLPLLTYPQLGVFSTLVMDARVAALCLHHRVTELRTADRDFSAFPTLKTRNPLVDEGGSN